MQERSIDGALLALRKATIRENRDGLEHVEALLAMRGVELPRVMLAKRKDVVGKGRMRRLVLNALKDGPLPLPAIAAHVSAGRPEISYKAAYIRTGQALARMKLAGLVRRDGRLWSQNFGPDGCVVVR